MRRRHLRATRPDVFAYQEVVGMKPRKGVHIGLVHDVPFIGIKSFWVGWRNAFHGLV